MSSTPPKAGNRTLTYEKCINYIRENLEGNKWISAFANWDMEKVPISEYPNIPSNLEIKTVKHGNFFRGGTFSPESIQLQKQLGGLCSTLLLYCYLRAKGISTNNIKKNYKFIYEHAMLSNERNYIFNKKNKKISIEGHLFTGGTTMPHFYQSSNPESNLSVAINYAKASAIRFHTKPILIKIDLGGEITGIQTDYENDCILPPFIPLKNVTFYEIIFRPNSTYYLTELRI